MPGRRGPSPIHIFFDRNRGILCALGRPSSWKPVEERPVDVAHGDWSTRAVSEGLPILGGPRPISPKHTCWLFDASALRALKARGKREIPGRYSSLGTNTYQLLWNVSSQAHFQTTFYQLRGGSGHLRPSSTAIKLPEIEPWYRIQIGPDEVGGSTVTRVTL